MANNIITKDQCPICGGMLKHEGSDKSKAYYRCMSCGNKMDFALEEVGSAEYILEKRELLYRIREGMIDWQVTHWDTLRKDIFSFLRKYDFESNDIQIQMGIIACITKGFNVMDADKYKQCKKIYKFTKKIYKKYQNVLKSQKDVELFEVVHDYKDSSYKYVKCRNEYLNTKLMWKAVFFIFRKATFH